VWLAVSLEGLSSSYSVLASAYTTGDAANATSDDGSLQLLDQAPVVPGRAVQSDPGGHRQDEQEDQAIVASIDPAVSASAFPVHPTDPVR
tara:strand:+ start:192 stop:461 length:270 start_codon:yes stop_codon:yes gene_type:complete